MNLDYIHINDVPLGLYRDGPVGVCVSGGADSAIMLYILMKHIEQELHIYNYIAGYRRHALEKPFDNVVEKCIELTGKKNVIIHKEYVTAARPEFMFNEFTKLMDNGIIDIMYFGLTKFPPTDVWKDWDEKLSWSHIKAREDGVVRPLFGITIPMPEDDNLVDPSITIDGKNRDKVVADQRVYVPWVNCNKRDIAGFYKAMNVEKELYPVSRSCENDNYPQGHCGKCWWCGERMWGFGYLE